jgi:ATP/maltotriose-dependent transcriptional regulator MalT
MTDLERGGAMADRPTFRAVHARAQNIAEQLIVDGDFSGAERRFQLALERMERLGIIQSVVWLLPQVADLAYIRGDWAEAEQKLGRFDGMLETISEHYLETQVRGIRAGMATARGDAARRSRRRRLKRSSVKDPQALGPALTGRARRLRRAGRRRSSPRGRLMTLPGSTTWRCSTLAAVARSWAGHGDAAG